MAGGWDPSGNTASCDAPKGACTMEHSSPFESHKIGILGHSRHEALLTNCLERISLLKKSASDPRGHESGSKSPKTSEFGP